MVTTTITRPATPAERTTAATTRRARVWAYRWILGMAALTAAITGAAITWGGSLAWFEAGLCLATTACSWHTTRLARQDAREWAALRAEVDADGEA